ncbi:MAG: carbonic anhydrase family protein [Azoarcus sp.]|jgi:carbonic anhydrase|nr:carbonic anhydrase family protein [Azoarcus sp.]
MMKRSSVHTCSALPRMLFLVVAMMMAATGHAAEWEKIVDGNGRVVEIDPTGIFNSDHGTKVSWGRIVLGDGEAARAGYRTIKALNRYDCLNRSFTTIKRVYLDGNDNVTREETLPEQAPTLVRRNSVDERIWRKMCGLVNEEKPAARANDAGGASRAAERIERIAAVAERAAKSTKTAREAHGGSAAAPLANPAPANVSPAPPKTGALPPPPVAPVDKAPPGQTVETHAPAPPARFTPTPAAPPMPRQATANATSTNAASVNARRNPAPIHTSTPVGAAPGAVPATASTSPHTTGRAAAPKPIILPAPRPAGHAATSAAARERRSPLASRRAAKGEGWEYSGARGPEFWGRLRPEWKICDEGTRQSPIDFAVSAPVAVDLDPVKFDYRPARFLVTDTGKQLRIKVDNKNRDMGMAVRGRRYALEGFTLHHPSEALIDGKPADMSVHFFHRDGEGRIAVLAVQAMRGDAPNALLQTLLNNLPLERGGGNGYMPETTIDPGAFLPKNPAHFLYMGSLAMPPCTEGVLWVVMKEPVTLSNEQFAIFARLHARNARPPQPANARMVLESR